MITKNTKIMKHCFLYILFIFVLLVCNSSPSFCQEVSLEGIWVLEKCEIQKDSNGVRSKVDYQPADGDIPKWYVFTELIFGKEKSCFIVLNEHEIVGKYKQTDTGLILDFIIMIPDYNYSLNNNTLVLKRRHNYFDDNNTESLIDIEMSYVKKTEQDEN